MAKTALIFPGQGSQYVSLGKDSFQLSSFAENIYQTANEILEYDIKEISFNSDITTISNTKICQLSDLRLHLLIKLAQLKKGGLGEQGGRDSKGRPERRNTREIK